MRQSQCLEPALIIDGVMHFAAACFVLELAATALRVIAAFDVSLPLPLLLQLQKLLGKFVALTMALSPTVALAETAVFAPLMMRAT